MSDWHSPWWYERLDGLDLADALDVYYDALPDPRDDPASPAFDPLDTEPRIDSFWDEREEDARIRRGLEA
jgi:hypothetical protein